MFPKRTHLWECKVNKETSLYEHSDESIEMRNHLLSYDILILEASLNEVWVECNGTL